MRLAATSLIIFFTVLTPLIAYSVSISIVSVDPLAVKPGMTYVLGKNNIISDRNEVRSIGLTLSGTTVTSATVQIYVRNAGWYRVTVYLYDSGGNIISTGSPPSGCVSLGSGLRSVTVPVSPQVSVDSVYTVQASATRLSSSCI